MLISTRGRYALRVLIDLAEHTDGGYVPMKDIAERQGISLKYLERIIPVLTKNGICQGGLQNTHISQIILRQEQALFSCPFLP